MILLDEPFDDDTSCPECHVIMRILSGRRSGFPEDSRRWKFILECCQTALTPQHDVFISGRILGPALNWLVGISGLSRFLLWLIFDSKIQLPDKLSRWWLLGLAIDRKLHRIREQIETKGTGNANGASVSRAVASQEDGSYSHGQRDSAIVGN